MDNTKQDSTQIATGIFWTGSTCLLQGLNCNPYLFLDGNEAVLIDPGSVLDWKEVRYKIAQILPLERISWIILSSQDPDTASAVPFFEAEGWTGTIACHSRAARMLSTYGISMPLYQVDQHEYRLTLKSGRELHFIHTPFLTASGAIATWDPETGTLFSSNLFGAFCSSWSLFADTKQYMEGMKAFHGQYVPHKDILAPTLDRLATLDIRIIAPRHGSVIQEDIPDYLNVLRNLEFGEADQTKASSNLAPAGGYPELVSRILLRWKDIYGGGAVLQLCDSAGILVNPATFSIDSFDGSAQGLWERIFDLALAHRDAGWLTLCEGQVRRMVHEYGIPLPAAFSGRLSWLEQQRMNLQKENNSIRDSQLELDRKLQNIQEQLIRDPVTGMYNEAFHERYLRSELIRDDTFEHESGFLYISIDHLGDINNRYGDAVGDEALKAVGLTILANIPKGAVCFRLQAAVICVYLKGADKQSVMACAELIRTRVATSEMFIERLTVSIAVVLQDEFLDQAQETLFQLIRNAGRSRLQSTRTLGMNVVCAETPRLEDDLSRPLILVADTDILMLDVLTRSCTSAGYRVLRYQDGEALWKAIHETDASLVISELFLPQLDAFGVRARMRDSPDYRNIPFILVSHRKDEATVQRSTDLGIEHYLKKPFFLNELIGIVNLRLGRLS